MKKNKLYTANRWNQPAFMSERNLFPDGGALAGFDRAASAEYGAKYGDEGFTLNDYMNSKNAFGISKADNPFSKGNLAGGLGAMAKTPVGGALVGGLAGTVGKIGGNLISGGLQSDVGNAIGSIGGTVGSAISTVNPVLGGIVSVGSGLIGGAVNGLFGTKVDEAKLRAANEGTAAYNNFQSNASSFDDVKGPTAQANVQDAYSGGLFSSGSARRKNEALKRARVEARQLAFRSVDNNINNLMDDQMNNALANYSAFGGPIETEDMGAIDYGFMSDYLTQKRRENDMKSKMSGIVPMPAFMPNSYAIGGDLQTNGGDFSTGMTHINAGLSHEENPNEGVQLGVDNEGTPNLVEEGETVYNDYVFSNRILADEATKQMFRLPKKKEITFSDISKRLEKEIVETPNDPISKAGFEKQMQMLEEQQERQKQEMEAERAKAAFEALSPEEQTALMQQRAEQEAMAQQAAMQQPTSEELAMAQQQQMMADGSEPNLGQEPQMMSEGGGIVKGDNGLIDYGRTIIDLPEVVVTGKKRKIKLPEAPLPPKAAATLLALNEMDKEKKQEEVMDALAEELEERKLDRQMYLRNRIHYYAKGGKMKENIYKLLNLDTDEKFMDWAKEHNIDMTPFYMQDDADYNWNALLQEENFKNALAGDNEALKDAISRGYNFGSYVADEDGTKRYTWSDDFWNNINEYSKQKGASANKYKIDTSYKGDVKELQDSNKYKAFTNYILNDASDAERMKYFQWIDANTGRSNKYITNGKLADNWKDMYQTARTDGLYGIQHYTPEMTELQRGNQGQNLLWNEKTKSWNPIIGNVNPSYKSAGNFTWQDPQYNYTYNYYTDPSAVAETPEAETPAETSDTTQSKTKPIHRPEWLRYAGLFGPAAGLGLMAAGVGRPDTAQLDASIQGAGDVTTANWKPLGNYLTYRPLDIWYEQNALNAQSRATDRALVNNSGGNRGTAMAGLLANGYNSQLASGNLFRQAQEYNNNLRKQVADFNRGTDQFNSEQYGATSRFNADAYNRARQANAQMRLQAAAQKMDADAGWYNSLYGNISGLFKGIGDIGTENYRMNRIAEMAARGDFGTATDETYGFGHVLKSGKKKSKGGKMNKKRGLTI